MTRVAPFVTSVGGTSFGTFDPGSNRRPSYPARARDGLEPLNLCSGTRKQRARFLRGIRRRRRRIEPVLAAARLPAWSRGDERLQPEGPALQPGPDGPVAAGRCPTCQPTRTSSRPTRSLPGRATPRPGPAPRRARASRGRRSRPAGSASAAPASRSPVWSAIIALSDQRPRKTVRHGQRGPVRHVPEGCPPTRRFFHDITGVNQTENNNGFYPTTAAYDMATGIGTPRITAIAMATP